MRRAWLGLLVLLAGCRSIRSDASDAYDRREWSRAAELYERVLAEHPADKEAQSRLVEARTHVVEGLFDESKRSRDAGQNEAALKKVDEAMHAIHDWRLPAVGRLSDRIRDELGWAGGFVKDEVMRPARANLPLAAESALAKRRPLLENPELGPLGRELTTAVHEAGRASCTRVAAMAKPDTPFLAHRIISYCKHFEAAVALDPALPLVGKVVMQGRIDGATDDQMKQLAASLNAWLQRSSWYAPSSQRAAIAFVQGKHSASFRTVNVHLTQPWKEAISYQELENYQEPYTENYVDTEYYTEQVPYTVYETRTRPCGFGTHMQTCTESVPTTQYRSEQRTRQVTKQRTAYRNAVRVVTKVRYEDRVFSYDARELRGEYDSAWAVQLTLIEGVQPMVLKGGGSTSRKGYDHDVTFAPAKVFPQHDVLMTHDGWFSLQLQEMEKTYTVAAVEHYKRSFCQVPSFTEEEAARCAWERQGAYPPGVRAALTKVFGEDVDGALTLDP
jgi:hypothetical protein